MLSLTLKLGAKLHFHRDEGYTFVLDLLGRVRACLVYARAASRIRRSPRTSLILRYHSICTPDETGAYVSPGITLPPRRFEEHVRFLTERFDVIDLDEALRRAREGRPRHCRPGIVITFDDGYQDNFVHALPILQRAGATATFYIVAGSIWPDPAVWTARLRQLLTGSIPPPRGPCPVPVEFDPSDPQQRLLAIRRLIQWMRGLRNAQREQALSDLAAWLGKDPGNTKQIMMGVRELRGMAEAGMTIGAHTCSHPLLPVVPHEEARAEIVDSKKILEEAVGRPIHHFSYPNPGGGVHENARTRAMVRQSGYRTATVSTAGTVGPRTDPFSLPRFGVNAGSLEGLLFRALGEGKRPRRPDGHP